MSYDINKVTPEQWARLKKIRGWPIKMEVAGFSVEVHHPTCPMEQARNAHPSGAEAILYTSEAAADRPGCGCPKETV